MKDWAACSGASGLEQWCAEALSPTGALTVFPPTASSTGRRLCFCACCCQTPTGYRADDERTECTCKVSAADLDPKAAEISRLLAEKKFVQETGDATVAALADALISTANNPHAADPCWCHGREPHMDHSPRCESRRAALRLAGRLP